MVRVEREQLCGDVEVDEALVGGVEHGGKPGLGTDKRIVAIAVEVKQPKGLGRVRMRHIPDASDFSLRPFVCDMVAAGSTVLYRWLVRLQPAIAMRLHPQEDHLVFLW